MPHDAKVTTHLQYLLQSRAADAGDHVAWRDHHTFGTATTHAAVQALAGAVVHNPPPGLRLRLVCRQSLDMEIEC